MESKSLEVGKRITQYERANPDAKNVPKELRKAFHDAWLDDRLNNRPRIDYMWKGEPYYSDVNGRGDRYSRSRTKKGVANANRRSGQQLTLDDFINHPRFKGDPKLARAMYDYNQAMLRRQYRFNSKTNQLDHIHPVSKGGVEHYKNKVLTGDVDNLKKSAQMPSKQALDYMGIGTTKADMIDAGASSQWPRQTGRDKRTILQGDLGIEYTKGMGPKNFLEWAMTDTARKDNQAQGLQLPDRIRLPDILSVGMNLAADAGGLPTELAVEGFNRFVDEPVRQATGKGVFEQIPSGTQEERRAQNKEINGDLKKNNGHKGNGFAHAINNQAEYIAKQFSKGKWPYNGDD